VFLNGIFLGLSSFSNAQSAPAKRLYDKITVYGNAIIDKLNIKSTELTNAQLLTIDITDTLGWEIDSLATGEFENTLDAGNITSLTSAMTIWEIVRREVGDTVLTSLAKVDKAILEYTDYLAQANKNYEYLVYPETATQVGQALLSPAILADFFGVYLIDEDSETVLFFDLDIATDEITNETDMTEFQTYTKYNAYAFGDRDFLKGHIQATAGYFDTNGDLIYDLDYFENIKTIINNKKDKVLKFRNGQMIRVITSNFRYSYMDSIGEQLYTINFDFIEVGEI